MGEGVKLLLARLSGGSNTTPGAFSWVTPSATFSSTGSQIASRRFTPADTDNYNIITQNITVNVIPRYIKNVYMGNATQGEGYSVAYSRLMNAAPGETVYLSPHDPDNTEGLGDLNSRAGGEFIYLGYTLMTDPDDLYITDIYVQTNGPSSQPYLNTFNGVTLLLFWGRC